MTEQKNVLLIVGNGFDLNIGLKTSYKDFLSSIDVNTISNNLIYELHLRHKSNWVDIEKELEDCALNNLSKIKYENFHVLQNDDRSIKFEKDDYIQLKSHLKNYLIKQQNDNSINRYLSQNSYKLFLELCDRKDIYLTILNFNYTNTIKRLIYYLSFNCWDNLESRTNHIYVHGNLDDDIVFGISDDAKINKQHHYLLKSFDIKNNTKVNISKLLNNSDEILFYGYSLGRTDTHYFDDFFKESCVYDDNIEEGMKKKITFYHYKEEGYLDLFDRLFTLTNRNMSKLTHLNNVHFIDSSL